MQFVYKVWIAQRCLRRHFSLCNYIACISRRYHTNKPHNHEHIMQSWSCKIKYAHILWLQSLRKSNFACKCELSNDHWNNLRLQMLLYKYPHFHCADYTNTPGISTHDLFWVILYLEWFWVILYLECNIPISGSTHFK